MALIFDSHAHYDDEQFDEDREELLKELKENGVGAILNMSSDYESVKRTVELTKKYDFIYGAVGIHPEHADQYNEEVRKELTEILKGDKFKAVGEVGLDYYWDSNPPKEVQIRVLRDQYELAKSLGMPIILHDRESHEDILKIAKEYKDVISVFHSYSGSVEMAREIIGIGGYIGISGVLTFKNARKLPDVVKEIPLERMLIETDAPYMAPVPYRGKRNRSDYLLGVADKIAEIRELTTDEVLEITSENMKRLFSI
ncbi:MAG TPA: TatD family hydrolase [Proteiniclasticum sp.]|nr:TatD family hydrolase [Proteiniclasticum sp.]